MLKSYILYVSDICDSDKYNDDYSSSYYGIVLEYKC